MPCNLSSLLQRSRFVGRRRRAVACGQPQGPGRAARRTGTASSVRVAQQVAAARAVACGLGPASARGADLHSRHAPSRVAGGHCPLSLELSMSKSPVRVAVTGAAGQIGYALLFRIAAGEMLGKDQPVILQLLEIPDEKAQKALKGVMMELDDCAFPLLAGMEAHSDPMTAFKDVDVRAARRRAPARPRHGAQGPALGQRARSSRRRARRSTRSPRATSRCWSSAIRPTPTPTSR